MNITLPRADLARLLASTTKVVEARNTIPILACVRLVVDGGKLTATATDLDIEITATVDAEAEADGAVCVSASLLDAIVKKLPASADVTLSLDSATLTVKSGRYTSKLQTLPVEDYPVFSETGFTTEFTADLATLFAPVSFAISTEETRFYLCGIYLTGAGGKLTAVATDGHRLSRNEVAEPDGSPPLDFAGIIVPRKMVGLVPKGEVAVSLSNTKIRLVTADAVITSKLIDGTFPDYQRVIPTGNDKLISFSSPEMRQAADRVSVVSSERGRAVKFTFAPGQATLAVSNPDSGSATEEIAVDYDGDPLDIGFNSAYVAELIGQFPSGEIRLALADGGAPALFTSDAAPGLLCVLMPMRT